MFKKLRGCQQYKWTGAPYSDQLSRGQPKQHQDPTESNCIVKENVRRILTICIFLPYLAIFSRVEQGLVQNLAPCTLQSPMWRHETQRAGSTNDSFLAQDALKIQIGIS